MKTDKVLVEVRTEELPPLLLWRLADDFPDSLLVALQKAVLPRITPSGLKKAGKSRGSGWRHRAVWRHC